jgi:hypothetical protein
VTEDQHYHATESPLQEIAIFFAEQLAIRQYSVDPRPVASFRDASR